MIDILLSRNKCFLLYCFIFNLKNRITKDEITFENRIFFTLASSGKWTSWSTWSSCSRDCVRHKRRSCSDPKPSNGGPKCDGQNHDVEVCTGGMCTGIFCLDNYTVHGNYKSIK